MKTRDGGPAFPTMKRIRPDSLPVRGARTDYVPEYIGGMSLRDYFAIQFAASLGTTVVPDQGMSSEERCARIAYRFADAMLEAREES